MSSLVFRYLPFPLIKGNLFSKQSLICVIKPNTALLLRKTGEMYACTVYYVPRHARHFLLDKALIGFSRSSFFTSFGLLLKIHFQCICFKQSIAKPFQCVYFRSKIVVLVNCNTCIFLFCCLPIWDFNFVLLAFLKCYCQRKPGRSKRSRSAVDLHLFNNKSYLKKLSTITFAEPQVLFSGKK